MRAWWSAAACWALLLSGCMGRGGNGGDSSSDGSLPMVLAVGGSGTAGRDFVDGVDGCDLEIRAGNVSMCGVRLQPSAAGFTVAAVDGARQPMQWEDLRVAAPQGGFTLRAGGGSVPMDRPADYSDRFDGPFPPPPGASHLLEAGFDGLLSGPLEVGQSFDVCGTARPATVDLWVRDVRPVGALFGIQLRVLGCDGTPWAPVLHPAVADYLLRFTGPEAAGMALGSGFNCVEFPSSGEALTVRAEATWQAKSPLAEELEFSWRPTSGAGESVVSTSPLNHTFAIGGPGGALVVDAAGSGAAVDQEVSLRLRVVPPSSGALPISPGAC